MRLAFAAVALLLLSGCGTVGYYWQSVNGHLQMLSAARPVADVLADAQTPQSLKAQLQLSQRLRAFAVQELKLPDNDSYRRYADLRRVSVVWNVVAAQEFSLTLKTWCFAAVGCVAYRGYFDEQDARLEAARLAQDGFEVSVYGVPAYSTLGTLSWLGAFGSDPLLNTFIKYRECDFARLIFHELAHQVAYAKDDTTFNESFATAVERLGSQVWLARHATREMQATQADSDKRRQQFRALIQATRRELAGIYALKAENNEEMRARAASKNGALKTFKDNYAQLKQSWGTSVNSSGFDAWVAQANNATFGAQAAYDELVPGFEALFVRENRNWNQFYDAIKILAAQPKEQRRLALATQK